MFLLCWLASKGDCPRPPLFYVKCASAVCWVGNYSGINKLSCLLYALPLTARQGSFTASAPDVCLHFGTALAAMGRRFQGEA